MEGETKEPIELQLSQILLSGMSRTTCAYILQRVFYMRYWETFTGSGATR